MANTDGRPDEHQRAHLVAAAVHLSVALVLGFIVFSREPLLLQVSLDLPASAPGASDPSARFEFSRVDLGPAALVLLVVSAVARAAHRIPASRWIERGLVAPITTFLVAMINGVTDAGALIAIYSLTSAMVLFDLAQLRSDRISATSPWGLGTMVGIVPWGIIALHQVGAGFTGYPAPILVQIITMTVLLLNAAQSYAFWRERADRATEGFYVAVSTTTTCAFALLVAALLVTG